MTMKVHETVQRIREAVVFSSNTEEEGNANYFRTYGDGSKDSAYATKVFYCCTEAGWCVNVHDRDYVHPQITYVFLEYNRAEAFRLQFDNWERLCARTKGVPYRWK